MIIPYLYAWYYDMDEKINPIGFEYEDKTINSIDFFYDEPNESIDTRFIEYNLFAV